MEPVRVMLVISGNRPNIDFKDGRYSFNSSQSNKVEPYENISQQLSHNLGRMPLITDSNESFGQSVAINFYIAQKYGFMGNGLIETTRILEIQEHLKEMKSAYNIICPYGTIPTQEQLDKWFITPCLDESPEPANMKERSNRMMRWWCSRIEYIIEENYCVGSVTSLADILMFTTFGDYINDRDGAELQPHVRYPFASKARTDNVLNDYPKIKSIVNRIANEPSVVEWINDRGIQMF
jgi:glutathione S-transferase